MERELEYYLRYKHFVIKCYMFSIKTTRCALVYKPI
jgi:hypothetical protein